MRYLLIDDNRAFFNVFGISLIRFDEPLPEGELVQVKTFDEGIEALKNGLWAQLYLDNNLGEGRDRNGFAILKWLGNVENRHLTPKEIYCVSGCPEAVKRMIDFHNDLKSDGRLPECWEIYTKFC